VRHERLEAWKPGADGAWDRAAAGHLLRRAGFGAAPGEVERALESGLEATLAGLFAPRGHDPELRASIASLLGTARLDALRAWWMALILGGGDPLRERAALSWHDHFATSDDKVGDVRKMHAQNELFRELGLGDFRELLRAVARDPAMLEWLDGNENRAGHPNENFARELMELFALGIGAYSERDLREAARAFTGWGTRGRAFVFRREHHDGGTKEILGRRGAFTGEEALEIVLAHPACPRHVARRLIEEFVACEVEEGVVEALAAELVAREWSVGRTLETLLRSRLFFSSAARRSRIAGPVELVAGVARALAAGIAPLEAARAAARMGQALFRPPSVKGWDGRRAWIHAGTWVARHNAAVEIASSPRADLAARHGDDRTQRGERAVEVLLDGEASGELRDALRSVADAAPSLERARADVVTTLLLAPEAHLA
jgi:uncharacterized protein (DUF1800 family)